MPIMQKIATKIFIYSSLSFGVLGILWVILALDRNGPMDELSILITRGLMTCVFIIPPSFAVSIAGKYLMDSVGIK